MSRVAPASNVALNNVGGRRAEAQLRFDFAGLLQRNQSSLTVRLPKVANSFQSGRSGRRDGTIRGDKEAVRDHIAAAKAVRHRTLVTGVFSDRASSERAYDSLTLRGYRSNDVDVIMSDQTRREQFGHGSTIESGTKVPQGMGVGAKGRVLYSLTAIGVPENTAIRY